MQVSEEEARQRIEAMQEPYKLEILAGITEKHPGKPITIYHLGSTNHGQDKNAWWDLCAGPHVENTSEIDPSAVELESVAGACTCPRLPSAKQRLPIERMLHAVLAAAGITAFTPALWFKLDKWSYNSLHVYK